MSNSVAASPSHPPYIVMIRDALKSLTKDCGGATRETILVYISQNYNIRNSPKQIAVCFDEALKSGLDMKVIAQSNGIRSNFEFFLTRENFDDKKEKAASKSKKTATKTIKAPHPPYIVMIKTAIKSCSKNRCGVSRKAILAYILQEYKFRDGIEQIVVCFDKAISRGLNARVIFQPCRMMSTFKFYLPSEEYDDSEEDSDDEAAPKQKKYSHFYPTIPAPHPSYIFMIQAAIKSRSKKSGGASENAILAYILQEYDIRGCIDQIVLCFREALRSGLASGALSQFPRVRSNYYISREIDGMKKTKPKTKKKIATPAAKKVAKKA